jgi:hypothetical protein
MGVHIYVYVINIRSPILPHRYWPCVYGDRERERERERKKERPICIHTADHVKNTDTSIHVFEILFGKFLLSVPAGRHTYIHIYIYTYIHTYSRAGQARTPVARKVVCISLHCARLLICSGFHCVCARYHTQSWTGLQSWIQIQARTQTET